MIKINTPVTGTKTPSTKGGAGSYDGEKGYPPRTKSSGPPEKVRDGKY